MEIMEFTLYRGAEIIMEFNMYANEFAAAMAIITSLVMLYAAMKSKGFIKAFMFILLSVIVMAIALSLSRQERQQFPAGCCCANNPETWVVSR